jgi:hypothetical protein
MPHLEKAKPNQKIKCEKKAQKIIRALWLAVGFSLRGIRSHWDGTASFAHHTFSVSCSRLFLQKLNKNV